MSKQDSDPLDGATEPTKAQSSDALLAFWPTGSATFPVPAKGRWIVGRGAECEVRIDHPSISRKHAALHFGSAMRVEDLGSMNGTLVGGSKIPTGTPFPVSAGMLIQIGECVLTVPGRARDESPARAPVVRDEAMKRLYALVDLVARGNINVLLVGETGVGKEVLAETIHARSARAAQPFVCVNCASLPDTLLESELFGFEKGAFTGAAAPKAGLIESADGGTVFLDEIGEMSASAQAKVLRAIEKREVMRVGGMRPKKVDVRFVAATHRDLRARVASGQFREDLYYRLDGVSIHVPPLRERASDILALAESFLAEIAPGVELTEGARRALQAHAWPGNVRELRNVVERAVLLAAGGPVREEHVTIGGLSAADPSKSAPPPAPAPRAAEASASGSLASELAKVERDRMIAALEECGGNQTEAAKRLGMSRSTFITRMKEYDMPRPRKR